MSKKILDKLDEVHDDIRDLKSLKKEVKKNTAFRQRHTGVYKFLVALAAVIASLWAAFKGWAGN